MLEKKISKNYSRLVQTALMNILHVFLIIRKNYMDKQIIYVMTGGANILKRKDDNIGQKK
ncbi:MAG: hypothetical protein KAV45_14685 [Calditrichia bacterium]|nr:hypothetical protein [Calditrichia bacterium]